MSEHIPTVYETGKKAKLLVHEDQGNHHDDQDDDHGNDNHDEDNHIPYQVWWSVTSTATGTYQETRTGRRGVMEEFLWDRVSTGSG